MYTDANDPINGAQRKSIMEQLRNIGFNDTDRLPESLTLDDIYRFYGCKDGDPQARGIYSIVNKVMNSR